MSISQNKKRKAAKAKKTPYEKEVARKIRQGLLPRFHFVKDGGRLERSPATSRFSKPGLSLRMVSTLKELTKDQYEESPPFKPVINDAVLE